MDEQSVFSAAVEIKDTTAREAYLERACGGDPSLRVRVEELLRVHAQAGSFMDAPAADCTATVDRPISEAPGTIVGPYKLLQQIGEGGMGVVFMAEQTTPVERRVAIKIIKPGMDTKQVIARFEAERQALAMMDHPNIAKVLDAGTTQAGRPYFVMELVNGIPVTQFCNEQRLTAGERLELFIPICRAVQHAHHKGIIHRDIKPSNVLVALYDSRPVPKVIDFGVAKAIGQRLTEKTMFTALGQIVGTVEYMSPEQAQRNQLDIDTRSDVYSLGVVLYELLTGETPFDKQRLRSAAIDELLRIIREEEPPRPSTRLSRSSTLPSTAANWGTGPTKLSALIRGELDWIVMKALEKDRARRYETPAVLASDVQHFLNDDPVMACPPSVSYRFGKFARRHRGGMITAAAVTACLILALVGTSSQAVRAIRAERMAIQERRTAEQNAERAQIAAQEERNSKELCRNLFVDYAIDTAFSGDSEQTREAVNRLGLLDARPNRDLLQTLSGLSLLFDGKQEKAVQELKEVALDNSHSFLAYSSLWSAFRYSGQFGDLFRVERLMRERHLSPESDCDQLFHYRMILPFVPPDEIDAVIRSLDELIQKHQRWGAAYAVRAVAWDEKGMETQNLEDFRKAVNDIEMALTILKDSPLVLTTALSIVTDGTELAQREENHHDAECWKEIGEGICRKLAKRPDSSMGQREITIFRHVSGQEPLTIEKVEEYELSSHHKKYAYFSTSCTWMRHRDAMKLQALEKELRQSPDEMEAQISLALILTEKSPEGREEALRIFNDLQQSDTMPIGKMIASYIPLLLGKPNEARGAARKLLNSGELLHERRMHKYMVQYLADELDENELVRRAGPFTDRRCNFFHEIGLRALANGDRPKAKQFFQDAVQTGQVGGWGYHTAWIFLQRLEDDRTWPSWIATKKTD